MVSEQAIQQPIDEEGCGAFFVAVKSPQVQVTSDIAVTYGDAAGDAKRSPFPAKSLLVNAGDTLSDKRVTGDAGGDMIGDMVTCKVLLFQLVRSSAWVSKSADRGRATFTTYGNSPCYGTVDEGYGPDF